MEEKERYEYFFGTNTIKDNKTNQFYGCVVDLLNQQDKRIKDLEDLVIEYKNKLYRRLDQVDNLIEKNKQLKQQLAESERKNFELLTKLNLKEYAPAFCTLADRDCEALGQIEELKQQLAEKDKAIENWQTMYESVVQTCHNDKEEIERLNKQHRELTHQHEDKGE